MTEVNELIKNKLQKYPEDVRAMAMDVVKVAGELTEQALQEHIETLLRKTIRIKGAIK